MSEGLKQFLQSYIGWVEDGAPDHSPYERWRALCSNLNRFSPAIFEMRSRLRDEMCALFVEDGLDADYPFGGEERFVREVGTETHHLNELRINWIKSKLEIATCTA